jgi:hypothetical protein
VVEKLPHQRISIRQVFANRSAPKQTDRCDARPKLVVASA